MALRIVQLRGYLFFGQSLSLSEHLHREIVASLMTAVESESGDGASRKSIKFHEERVDPELLFALRTLGELVPPQG